MDGEDDRMTEKKSLKMTEERIIELTNKEIDGLNTAAEHQELMQIVSADEHTATLYHELLGTARVLQGIEQKSPPSYLRSHILNSIAAAPVSSRQKSAFLASWIEPF